MDTRISVLIADGSEDFSEQLRESIQSSGYDVVGVAYDGLRAVELLEQTTPDVMILDITLSKLDGLGVLKAVHAMQEKPAILVTSHFRTDHIIGMLNNYDVKYFMLKPFTPRALIERIGEFGTALPRSSAR